MRKGYWLIIVFGAWCIICALWYMFSVKKLPNTPEISIIPAPTTLAIAEILIMITVAFFIGFGLAWLMRSDTLEVAREQAATAIREHREAEQTADIHREAAVNWERRATEAEQKAANALLSSDQLTQRIADLTTTKESLAAVNRELEAKKKQLEGEIDSSRFRIRLLESELEQKNSTLAKVEEELQVVDTRPKVEHRDWSDHPFVRPVDLETESADDLTEIKGIGPAFQRKLNSLDIFTFRQISELDGEGVERLAEVIEVFPDRIHRDNWIGQATRLYLKKIGRED